MPRDRGERARAAAARPRRPPTFARLAPGAVVEGLSRRWDATSTDRRRPDTRDNDPVALGHERT